MYFKGWINRKGGSIDWGVYTEQDTLVLDRVFIGEICGYKTLEAEQKKINKPLLFGKFEVCFSPFVNHWPPRISGLSSTFIQFCLRTCKPLWPTAFTFVSTCMVCFGIPSQQVCAGSL